MNAREIFERAAAILGGAVFDFQEAVPNPPATGAAEPGSSASHATNMGPSKGPNPPATGAAEPSSSASHAKAADGPRDPCFCARPERIAAVMLALRDDLDLRFDFLQNLTAVDWIKRNTIEIVYHLFSYPHRHSACVKVDVPRATPRLPSVSAIWPTANWHEREQFDLLGVVFEGHPDLRRL